MKKFLFLILSLFFLVCERIANAALPVFDTAAINQSVMQFNEMKKQYDMMKKQYDELMALKGTLTESGGLGALLNNTEDAASRRPLPQTWQEVVQLQKEGFFGTRLDYYSKLLPSINSNLLSGNPKDRNVVGYKMDKEHTDAAFAATEAVYNQLSKRLETIESLTAQIDKTKNIKQAMDLNSRIVAETGYVSLDLARLNSAQVSLQAILQNDSNREVENHSEFFSKPKN